MYHTFDHGEWGRIQLHDDDVESLDSLDKHSRPLSCGHWLLWLTPIRHWQSTLSSRLERWEYAVSVELPGSDAKGGPVLFETVLVRDLSSLLSLFAQLRAANVGTTEDIG